MKNNETQSLSNDTYVSEPRVYEVGYHIMPTVNEGDLSTQRDALVAFITKFKGLVISEGQPQLIDLAYDMTKMIANKKHIYSQAYFGWIKFDVSPDAIEALTADVDGMDSLIRFIMIKTERENTLTSSEPFKVAQNRRDDVSEDEPTVVENVVETVSEVVDEVVETVSEVAADIVDAVTPTESDDLTKIEGIGPKIAEVFAANGIVTFADLSGSKVGDLRTILADNGLSQHEPKTWSKQATLAKNEKWDELKTLQDELDGGK